MRLFFGKSIEALQADTGAEGHHILMRALGPCNLDTLKIGAMFRAGDRLFTRTTSGAAW